MAVRNPLQRRPRWLLPVLIGLAVLVIVVAVFVNVYTDLLFFRSVSFSKVFDTVLGTRLVLFAIFGVIMAATVGATIIVAYKIRPAMRPLSLEQQNLERYRVVIEPYHRWIVVGICALSGIAAGWSAAGRWRTYMLWANGQSFGVKDQEFNRDVSYYTFTYPFQRFLLGYGFTVVVVCLLLAVFVHYLFGGIRLQTPDRVEKVVPAAKVHISVLLGLFVLLKAVAYYLDRFGLVLSSRGTVTGASYTDVHAVLPAKTILLFISILCAVLFIYNIRQRGWILPALSFGILVISSLVIGGLYPTLIKYVSVRPNEAVKERPYIARNIESTRNAYAIKNVDIDRNYPARADVTAAEVNADTGTVPNTRLLDPVVLSKTYEQLQQIRSYYGFPATLDIDRYTIDGKTQDYVVSARELDAAGLGTNQRNWINLYLNYTHGKGFVAAPANSVDENGRPNFIEKDLPQKGPIDIKQDRIYFGEDSPKYSIVGTKQAEIDGPSSSGDANDQVTNRYDGPGGVSVGSTFNRLLFSLKFAEKNVLLSGAITKDSRVLYVRSPRERVQKVAPWLTLDGDPYPAVVDGKILWILDGYTTTNNYPYSQRTSFGQAASDADTGTANRSAQSGQINYIRNSVKATVDSYTGEVKLYAFDKNDPILKTWMKAFPGTVSTSYSAELAAHFRYPEDLFKVQRDLIGRYHVTDPVGFYTQEDFWSVPDEPGNAGVPQPPFYQYAEFPKQDAPRFNLTSPLNSQRAPKLAAFMYVSGDPQDYGQIHVLELPQGVTINGPVQAKNAIESNADVARQLSLLRQGGSSTISGNLLTLPVAQGIIYVQPYYVQAAGRDAYPTLQTIAVAYGDRVGYGATLAIALDGVFGSGAGDSTDDGNGGGGGGGSGGTVTPEVRNLADQAQKAFTDAQTATGRGDFVAAGEAQKRLQALLNQLTNATKATPTASASVTPSAPVTPSGSGTPSGAPSSPVVTPSVRPTASVTPTPSPSAGP